MNTENVINELCERFNIAVEMQEKAVKCFKEIILNLIQEKLEIAKEKFTGFNENHRLRIAEINGMVGILNKFSKEQYAVTRDCVLRKLNY